MPYDALAQHEGDGLAIFGHFIAFGQQAIGGSQAAVRVQQAVKHDFLRPPQTGVGGGVLDARMVDGAKRLGIEVER